MSASKADAIGDLCKEVEGQIITNERPVPESKVMKILLKLMEVLNQENNVVLVAGPVYIVGDIHGQLEDLRVMFHKTGLISRPDEPINDLKNNKYLFLGDYVDRGYHSLNTFLYLACLKLRFPDRIVLLRGNHESRQVSTRYGFYYEVILNYGHAGLWMMCNDVFDLLPMAALVDEDVFCVHGGLSPALPLIERISLLDRQKELPPKGPLADLCWSDPESVSTWRENTRGAGYLFGPTDTRKFTIINRLRYVCRSHQLAMQGYAEYFGDDDGHTKYRLITVWSAPNYSYRSGNKASVLLKDRSQDPWPDPQIIFEEASQLGKEWEIKPSNEERPVNSTYFA